MDLYLSENVASAGGGCLVRHQNSVFVPRFALLLSDFMWSKTWVYLEQLEELKRMSQTSSMAVSITMGDLI